MNGQEIERLLTLIDANIEANTILRRAEIFRFIEAHEDEVVRQLRETDGATIPTSMGAYHLSLSDLQAVVA